LCSHCARLEFELGVTDLSHLGKIQTLEFRFCADSLANDSVNDHVDRQHQREDHAQERGHADQLRDEFTRSYPKRTAVIGRAVNSWTSVLFGSAVPNGYTQAL